MKTKLVVLALIVLVPFTGCNAGAANWQKVTSADGKYTVEMPGNPKKESKTETANGVTMTFNNQTVDLKDRAFLVSHSDIPAGGEFNINEGLKSLLGRLNGKVVSETNVTVGGQPGKQAVVEVTTPAKGVCVLQMMVANGKVYQLMAIGSTVKADSEEVQRFLKSFELTK